jgi:hypothetical protein
MKNLQEISNQLEHKVKPVSGRKPQADGPGKCSKKNDLNLDALGKVKRSRGLNSQLHTDENEKQDRN